MKMKLLSAAVAALLSAPAFADALPEGPMAFEGLTSSKTTPSDQWDIPAGYSQRIVSDESRLDIYAGDDWNDMNTVNEDKDDEKTGRYLYRTHEVRPDAANLAGYEGGAVSVVDLKNGKATVLVQRYDWEALDGIVWTPWNTILMAEETGGALLKDPEVPQAKHGLLYEISLRNHTKAKSVDVRPLLGSLAHEGIELDGDGNVYVIDEYSAGGIYKFVPEVYGDLSSGDLYALVLDSATPDRTGPAEWVKLDRDAVQVSAREAGAAVGGVTYGRPEDLERIGNTLYVAMTSENRVMAITLGGKPMVTTFVDGGTPNFVADKDFETAEATFEKVDNLASGPDGRLWIVEDNIPSDIWVADPDSDLDGASDKVRLFASFNDGSAEGTGIYFGNDPHTLFVNVQHSADDNDRTVAISRDLDDEDHHHGKHDRHDKDDKRHH